MPKPLANTFAVLTERSIFVKGDQTVEDSMSRSSRHSRRSDDGVTSYRPPVEVRPEQTLVFNGATRDDDGRAVALVEHTDTHRIEKVSTGDPLARGHVKSVTLDSLDYEVNGRVTRVSIGDNLDGDSYTPPAAVAAGAPTGSSAGSTPATPLPGSVGNGPPISVAPPTGGPLSSGPGISSPGAPTTPPLTGAQNSLLERMRLKRQRELAGGR